MNWRRDLEGVALEIAAADRSPLRVDAGPGAGKTYALMRRVWRLLEDGVDPRRIFVGTFTRTAASDLKRSLAELGVPGADRTRASTLHAFCYGLLARDEVFAWTQRNPRPVLGFEERFMLEDLQSAEFGGVRDRRRRLLAFTAAWARLQSAEPGWPDDPVDQAFQRELERWLRFHKAMHIGELIWEAVKYLRDNPGAEFEHVLVDEYQDLNRAEQELVSLLARRGSLTIIGDEDQSIYSFRYAHPEGMREFADRHAGTHDLQLLNCRRCPTNVVTLANALIRRNERRAPRVLQPFPGNPEGEVRVVRWESAEQEADGIAQFIARRVASGEVTPGKVLVLSPRRYFGQKIRDKLAAQGVLARSFFSEEELEGNPKRLDECRAQAAYTLLYLLADPEDAVSLRCWCGFGSASLNRTGWTHLRQYCEQNGVGLREGLVRLHEEVITLPRCAGLVERFRLLKEREAALHALRGVDLLNALFPPGEPWAEGLRLLVAVSAPEDTDALQLRDALRSSLTQPELPTDVDYVRVMSLHKSKGLTADLVVVAGCVQGCLPVIDSELPQAEQERLVEEQRRLFYVALTRAKRTLVLSSARTLPRNEAWQMRLPVGNGGLPGTAAVIASTFLDELGPTRPATETGPDFLA